MFRHKKNCMCLLVSGTVSAVWTKWWNGQKLQKPKERQSDQENKLNFGRMSWSDGLNKIHENLLGFFITISHEFITAYAMIHNKCIEGFPWGSAQLTLPLPTDIHTIMNSTRYYGISLIRWLVWFFWFLSLFLFPFSLLIFCGNWKRYCWMRYLAYSESGFSPY